MGAAQPLADLTEKEWTAQVVELARTLGWKRYHTWRSKHSEAGWPDEALLRDRLILAELKREGGKPSLAQREWMDALAAAGQEVYLWRPSDLDEIARILSKRWFVDDRDGAPVLIPLGGGDNWTPGSLWIPGVGRADSLSVPT